MKKINLNNQEKMETEEKLLSFTDYCKQHIIDQIDSYEGTQQYARDLGFTLTEGINVDGSATYSTYKAIQYLKEWWDDAAEYFQYAKDNYGEVPQNPFENPEAYMVCMIIEGVRSLLSQSDYIDKHWNDEIELTKRNIKKILKEIEDKEVEW